MGAMKNPRFEEPGAKGRAFWDGAWEGVGSLLPLACLLEVERLQWQKVPDTVGGALGGGQHLDVDAAHDVFDHRTVAIHVRSLQVGFERRHVRPLFDDGDDVVSRRGGGDAGSHVNCGAVLDAAVFVADDVDDAVELGEKAFAGALSEFDRGDDVDHGVTALGEGGAGPAAGSQDCCLQAGRCREPFATGEMALNRTPPVAKGSLHRWA